MSSLENIGSMKEDKTNATKEWEDCLERLRAVTGIPCPHNVVKKFESQLLVKQHLIALINSMEKKIQRLRDDCSTKRERLADVKHTFETATSE